MKKIFTYLFCLSLSLIASETVLEGWQEGEARIIAGGTFGRTVGVDKSYGELGIFAPINCNCTSAPFLDFRNYWFDHGYGSSVGAGFRYGLGCDTCQALGFNVYYDFLQYHCVNFERMGVGVEYLSECFDVRANGYFPIDSGRGRISSCFFEYPGGYTAVRRDYLLTLTGFDAEIGTSIFNTCGFDFYVAAGPYYFHHNKDVDFWGGMVRLATTWNDFLTLEVRATHDERFHTRVQGKVLFEIPLSALCNISSLWCNTCCEPCCCNHLFDPVQRNGFIGLDRQCCWDWNW